MPGRARQLFRELRRRHVFKVAGAYAAVAFVVLQAAAVVLPALRLPDAAMTFLVVVAILGFPLALVVAWAFELTPDGVVRTPPSPDAASPSAHARPGEGEAGGGSGEGGSAGEGAAAAGGGTAAGGEAAIGGEARPGAATDAGGTGPGSGVPPGPGAGPAAPRAGGRRTAVAVLALAVIAAAGWLVLGRRGPEPGSGSTAGEGRPSRSVIAVLPFAVRGGEELAYLGEGMVDLLSAKLAGAGELRTADPHALLALLRQGGSAAADPEAARIVAERAGAGLFVLGSVVEAGGRLQLDASLYETGRPQPVARASVTGSAGDLFGLVDRLTAALLAEQHAGPGGRLAGLAARTTASLPALKAYLQGESAFRAGRWDEALEAFREAAALDTTFALAHYRLAVSAGFAGLGTDRLQLESARRAVRHAERLSDRERALLEAFLALQTGRISEAERRYRAILAVHPDDIEAWFQLADVLFHRAGGGGRARDEAWDAFRRVLAFEPDHSESLVHLMELAAIRRDYATFDTLLARLDSTATFAVWAAPVRAFALRGPEEQRRVLAALETRGDVDLAHTAAHAVFLLDDLDAAERIASLLVRPGRSAAARAYGHDLLAQLDLARGRWRAALAHLREAEPLDRARALEMRGLLAALPHLPVPEAEVRAARDALDRWDAAAAGPTGLDDSALDPHPELHAALRLYLLGLVEARLNDPASAEARAAALEAAADTASESAGSTPRRQLAGSIRAYLARLDGRPAGVLAALDAAPHEYWGPAYSPFESRAADRFLRADALRALGRDAEALDWYASFQEHSSYSVVFHAPAHLHRGEIHERLGEPDEAARHYARFLELWSEADPELRPEVDEVRRRLAGLAAGGRREGVEQREDRGEGSGS